MTTAETFAEKHARLRAEGAIAAQAERAAHRDAVRDALRISGRERLGETIDLAAGVTVAQVEGGYFGPVWRAVVNGRADISGYTQRWTAILAAVGLVHNAGHGAETFAARVLNVPSED